MPSPRRRTVLLSAVVVIVGALVGALLAPRSTAPARAPAAPAALASAQPPPPPPSLPAPPPGAGDLAGVPAAAIVPARQEPVTERYVARDPDEWQGMLVREDERPTCTATELCGLAMVCLPDGTCGACRRDQDCAAGEGCVLDHCVKRANITCRRKRDCDQSSGRTLCVLTGYSSDARGNAEMRSECLNDHGGRPAAPTREPAPSPSPPQPSMEQKLLDSLEEAK